MKTTTILVALLLAACGTLEQRPYVEPTAAPTATIILTNNSTLNFVIYEDAYDCRNQFWIQDIPPGQRKIKIPANRNVAFLVYWGDRALTYSYSLAGTSYKIEYCELQLSMEPVADKTYRVAYVLEDKPLEDKSCYVQVFDEEQFARLSESGGDTSDAIVPFRRRERARAWDETGAFCKPLAPGD